MWLGELTGRVRVFCARSFTEETSISLASHVQSALPEARELSTLAIGDIRWLKSRNTVLVVTKEPAVIVILNGTTVDGTFL